jgi:hypothetical protein
MSNFSHFIDKQKWLCDFVNVPTCRIFTPISNFNFEHSDRFSSDEICAKYPHADSDSMASIQILASL